MIFRCEDNWPRDVPRCRNIFLEITIRGPCKHLGGQIWATTELSGTKTVTMKLTKKAAVKLFLFYHTPSTYLLST